MAISLPDGLNPNDGPPPYTLLGADLIGSQQAIYNLQVTGAAATRTMSAEVRPTVLLEYRDGFGNTRTKFIAFPVPVSQAFAAPAAGDPTDFFIALRPGGTITGLSVSGNTVSFSASFSLMVLGYVNQPERFPVLPAFSCAAPPPGYPTACETLIRLRSACDARTDGSAFIATIPFQPLGTPPYSGATISTFNTMPNVLVAENDNALLSLQLSFPAALSYTDSTDTLFTQNVLAYTSVQVSGITIDPGDLVIANLRIGLMTPPSIVGSFFISTIQSMGGLVMLTSGQAEQVLTTPLVDCGPFPVTDTCILTTMFTVTEIM